MRNRICCILNLAAHYRAPIYKLMDIHLDCDFYITTWDNLPFKQMNYHDLKGFKNASKKILLFGNFYWQSDTIYLAFKDYDRYILTLDVNSISGWLLLILLKLKNKKSFIWTHGLYGNESFIRKTIKKLFFSLANKIFIYGQHAYKLMVNEGFKESKLVCVYNSLDYNQQKNIREKLVKNNVYSEHFGDNFPVIIFIGRIRQIKRIDLLIEALFILKNKSLICNLIIIGTGTDEIQLRELSTRFNLNKNIWFYGESYDEEEIGKLIFNANLCVSPGNVGLTAIHSLVYGTPVITHNNFNNQMPEFEAIQKGLNGDFFKEGSAIDLANTIAKWINLTSAKRNEVRKNCYKVIDEKYNPYKQIEILTNNLV